MLTLRTPETQSAYERFKKYHPDHCPFCLQEDVVEMNVLGKDWMIIRNKFPYDRYFKINDMLAPIEHCTKLTRKQEREYLEIIKKLEERGDYHQDIYNFAHRQSLRHWHRHLVTFYDEE